MSDLIFGMLLAAVWMATLSGMAFAIYDGFKSTRKWNEASFIFLSIILSCTILACGCLFHCVIVGIHAGILR